MNTDVSRRAFFGTVASVAALPALAGAATPVAAPPPASTTLKLGVASYSMRKFTLDQTLEMARALMANPNFSAALSQSGVASQSRSN